MWWEKFGISPIEPSHAAKKKWFRAELTLKSVPHLEKAVKSASEKGALGWWVTPWVTTDKGLQATLSVYFSKKPVAQDFQSKPPPAPRLRAAS